jgi:hypothetical protein
MKKYSIKKLKILVTLSTILLMLFNLSGCYKLGEVPLGEMLNENPYSGNETLVFKTSEGNTIRFEGNGRYTDELRQSPNHNSYYWLNEFNVTRFTETNMEYGLRIQMASRYDRGFDMSLVFINYVEFREVSCDSWTSYSLPLDRKGGNLHHVFHDSLKVLDKLYYDVYVDTAFVISVTDNKDSCALKNNTSQLFYNTSDGFLRFDFADGTRWELKEILP